MRQALLALKTLFEQAPSERFDVGYYPAETPTDAGHWMQAAFVPAGSDQLLRLVVTRDPAVPLGQRPIAVTGVGPDALVYTQLISGCLWLVRSIVMDPANIDLFSRLAEEDAGEAPESHEKAPQGGKESE